MTPVLVRQTQRAFFYLKCVFRFHVSMSKLYHKSIEKEEGICCFMVFCVDFMSFIKDGRGEKNDYAGRKKSTCVKIRTTEVGQDTCTIMHILDDYTTCVYMHKESMADELYYNRFRSIFLTISLNVVRSSLKNAFETTVGPFLYV